MLLSVLARDLLPTQICPNKTFCLLERSLVPTEDQHTKWHVNVSLVFLTATSVETSGFKLSSANKTWFYMKDCAIDFWSQKKDVSEEKAPASRNSSLINTQKSRWGRALEYGAGRGTQVRNRISRPAAGGKFGTLLLPPVIFLSRPESSSSGDSRAAWQWREGEKLQTGTKMVDRQDVGVCM